jgi:hypothetical protein
MPGEITLSIALHVETTDGDPAPYWVLPDRGVDCLAAPRDVPREPNVD